MKVLVTGATGVTGGPLARYLAARGDDVRVLVRAPERAQGLDGPAIHAVQGDLKDEASIARAVDGVDVVYNLAALYREAGLPTSEYRAVNAAAVVTIVDLAKRAGV